MFEITSFWRAGKAEATNFAGVLPTGKACIGKQEAGKVKTKYVKSDEDVRWCQSLYQAAYPYQ
jgi:hypothetical protein